MGSYDRARASAHRRKQKRSGHKEAATHGWVKDNRSKTHTVVAQLREHIIQSLETSDLQRDTLHVHPSEMAKNHWCPRQTFYRVTGHPPDAGEPRFYWRVANILSEGHEIHAKYQRWLWDLGILEGMWKCLQCSHAWWALAPVLCPSCHSHLMRYAEVPIDMPEYMIIGHGDGIVRDETDDLPGLLLEVKSVGLRSIEIEVPGIYDHYKTNGESLDALWGRVKQPFPSHMRQVQVYLHDLKEKRGIDKALFIYEFKATQDFKAFVVDYNPRLAQPLLDKAKSVKESKVTGVPPERPEWATGPTGFQCKECPHATVCWSK
jgi:rubrerythrin